MMKKKYVTATGEVFMTNEAGIAYMTRMTTHVQGQYRRVDEAEKRIKELELKIKHLEGLDSCQVK